MDGNDHGSIVLVLNDSFFAFLIINTRVNIFGKIKSLHFTVPHIH